MKRDSCTEDFNSTYTLTYHYLRWVIVKFCIEVINWEGGSRFD